MEKVLSPYSYKNSMDTELLDSELKKPIDELDEEQISPHLPHENSKGTLLIITIDLGNDNKDNIEIKENDDPQELAYNFIIKNDLDFKILPILTENIKKNISELLKERSTTQKPKEESVMYFPNIS